MRLLKPDLEKYIIFIPSILEIAWESGRILKNEKKRGR
jgi:hypothetical protein